ALARTLILKPELLLLDEPTANLDPNSTLQIEEIIKDIQKNTDTTLIISTHNLKQGLNLCEEIALLNKEIIQKSPSKELFKNPKNKFVANFLGIKNIKKGIISQDDSYTNIDLNSINIQSTEKCNNKESYIYIRSDEITMTKDKKSDIDNENQIKGTITKIIDLNLTIEITVNAGTEFKVDLTRHSFNKNNFDVGEEVWLQFEKSNVHMLNE
ncbi:TOBE domain-containing protein, partial [Methanobrevibacter sp.]